MQGYYASKKVQEQVKADYDAGISVADLVLKYNLVELTVQRIADGTYNNKPAKPRNGNHSEQEPELPSLKVIMQAVFDKKRERIVALEEQIRELKAELDGLEADPDYQAAKQYLAALTRQIPRTVALETEGFVEAGRVR